MRYVLGAVLGAVLAVFAAFVLFSTPVGQVGCHHWLGNPQVIAVCLGKLS